jgi:FtsP/CotA-like multicopper oxidase with cupredoxin domain
VTITVERPWPVRSRWSSGWVGPGRGSVSGIGLAPPALRPAGPDTAAVAASGEPASAPQVREFALTVGRVPWEVGPGEVVEAYAYNGQVPGPELRVREGDTVRVRVTNALAEPTTVHWHGVSVPQHMDGVPGLSHEPIAPGDSFTYEFVATPAGTR